jgi:hypothetical protein
MGDQGSLHQKPVKIIGNQLESQFGLALALHSQEASQASGPTLAKVFG